MNEVAALARAIAEMGPTGQIRRRQGLISAINADGTLDITIAGSGVVVTGVAAFDSINPRTGAACWLDTDGRDIIVVGMIATAATGFTAMDCGKILGFPKSVTRPGLLYCDGTVHDVVDHPDLGEYLGSTFGGNGTTTFAVPDFRGLFLRGYGTHGTLTDAVSAAVGAYQADQNQAHAHNAKFISFGNAGGTYGGLFSSAGNWVGGFVDSQGGTEARPNNSAVYWYIKA